MRSNIELIPVEALIKSFIDQHKTGTERPRKSTISVCICKIHNILSIIIYVYITYVHKQGKTNF